MPRHSVYEFARCDRPVGIVHFFSDGRGYYHVSQYCELGHHIRTKIFTDHVYAIRVVDRLRRWIEITNT